MDKYQVAWAGEFGKEYTDRCNVDYKKRMPIFKELTSRLFLDSVLEVGCNKGHNLKAINDMSAFPLNIYGIDTNKEAIENNEFDKTHVIHGSAYDLPWPKGAFNFAFTSGVLIHLPNDKLPKAMEEIYRVSSKYIMSIEYPEKEEHKKDYRIFEGDGGCWGRDYGKIWKEKYPNLKLLKTGKMIDLGDDGWGFSRDCNYWIFQK